MSSKNEIKKSNINTKSSLFGKISSKYMQKFIFSFISRYKCPEFAHELLKYNKGLSHLQSEIKNDNRINQLSNFRNWCYYLKDIYSASNEVAKKIYDDAYQNKYKKVLNRRKSFLIECIIYVCIFDIVYLTERKKIFNENDLKIQKAKSKDKKDKQEVSCKTTIFNIIREVINQSLNSKNSDLQSSVDAIATFYELLYTTHIDDEYVDCAVYNVIENHLSKKFPEYREDDKLKHDLCCLIIKILWLKNNNFYHDSIEIYNSNPNNPKNDLNLFRLRNFNYKILSKLELPNFDVMDQLINKYEFDYQTLITSLKRNDNLYSIVCDNRDFDIKAYFSVALKSKLERELTTKKQKDEFKKFIEGKSESKKDIKKEDPIPNCEKENFKNIE